MKTMKAAVVKAFGQLLEIEQVPVLESARGGGRLVGQTAAAFIPGHEGVGEMVALGANVSHLSLGDRVGIPLLYSA